MTDTETTIETAAPKADQVAAPEAETVRGRSDRGSRDRRGGRGGQRRSNMPRERSEFEQATIEVRRVARVMAGGRRFNFSVSLVLGDKRGRVGVGLGKGADTALAIDKAARDAKKNMITVARTTGNSIAHPVSAKYASSTIELLPSAGRGLVAGSAVRTVLEFAGVTDIVSKIHTRSKNKLTIARATVAALTKLQSR